MKYSNYKKFWDSKAKKSVSTSLMNRLAACIISTKEADNLNLKAPPSKKPPMIF